MIKTCYESVLHFSFGKFPQFQLNVETDETHFTQKNNKNTFPIAFPYVSE